MVALNLSKKLAERLAFLANETGQTPANFIREAILSKMEELEDEFHLERALAESDGTTVSWEDAMKAWDLAE